MYLDNYVSKTTVYIEASTEYLVTGSPVSFEIVYCASGTVPVTLRNSFQQSIAAGTDTLEYVHALILGEDGTSEFQLTETFIKYNPQGEECA